MCHVQKTEGSFEYLHRGVIMNTDMDKSKG